MSCASAAGTEDKFEFYIFQDDEENSQDLRENTDLPMAETQDNLSIISLDDDDDSDNDEPKSFNKLEKYKEKHNYEKYRSITSFGDDEPVDLLALANDVTADETANLLLPEQQPNFVDFDEFNICLNNILNDDVDSELELSPSVVMADTLASEVDEMFKVNNMMKKHETISHTSTTSLSPMDKNISSISSSSSSNCSSLQHIEHIPQSNNNNNNNHKHNDDLFNMVHFDDHMEFSFSPELDNATTITTTNKHNSNNNNNNNRNKQEFHNLPHGHNYIVDPIDSHDDLDFNMVDPIDIESTCNSTATVSASVTTTTNHEDDDDEDTTRHTALNNVIKRNSHSIVNIFQ